MSDLAPHIDFSRLVYPTDRLTIGQLRVVEPDLFARDDVLEFEKTWNDAEPMAGLLLEREIAHKAFAAALGLPEPHDRESRDELVEMLGGFYGRFGLSSGPKHTAELVRSIESQAVDQAKQFLGRSP